MIGGKIKYYRLTKGLSISELAKLTGISKSYLSYLERDIQKNPSLQKLIKIADTLEVSLDDILHIEEQHIENAEQIYDEEWLKIFNKAIKQGIKKEDLSTYIDFLEYQKSKKK